MDFSVAVTRPAEDDDSRLDSLTTTVDLRAPQDVAELAAIFHAELRSGTWNRLEKVGETVDGVATITQVYRFPGASPDDTELTVRISGGPFSTARMEYRNVIDDPEDPSFELLAGWQDELRTPGSTRPVEARLSTAADAGTLETVYLLTAETAAEAREAVARLVREDEFRQEPADGSGANAAPLVLIDQDQQRLVLEFAPTGDPEIVELTVSTGFDLVPIS